MLRRLAALRIASNSQSDFKNFAEIGCAAEALGGEMEPGRAPRRSESHPTRRGLIAIHNRQLTNFKTSPATMLKITLRTAEITYTTDQIAKFSGIFRAFW
jgi:hypothetical protein